METDKSCGESSAILRKLHGRLVYLLNDNSVYISFDIYYFANSCNTYIQPLIFLLKNLLIYMAIYYEHCQSSGSGNDLSFSSGNKSKLLYQDLLGSISNLILTKSVSYSVPIRISYKLIFGYAFDKTDVPITFGLMHGTCE